MFCQDRTCAGNHEDHFALWVEPTSSMDLIYFLKAGPAGETTPWAGLQN